MAASELVIDSVYTEGTILIRASLLKTMLAVSELVIDNVCIHRGGPLVCRRQYWPSRSGTVYLAGKSTPSQAGVDNVGYWGKLGMYTNYTL